MRSGNPALNEKTFESYYGHAETVSQTMTIQGTAWKTLILLILCTCSAGFTFISVMKGDTAIAIPAALIGVFGGLIVGFVTAFKPNWSPFTAPLYAILEGLFLGAISGLFEQRAPGIAIQAVAATFGTLFALLMAYQSGLIRATENFKLGVVAATGGICLLYFVSMILGMFGVQIPFIFGSGIYGIAFSVFVVIIAALNLVLDFDFIEEAANRGSPKYLEWYGAYALMVTLIWLYIEILRLLSKINSKD